MEVPPTSRFSLNNDTNDTNDLNSPSPRSSSSNGSDKYLIEEISEYDEDDFHTLKYLDVAESYRIRPKRPSPNYSIEFERLKPYLKKHINAYFERDGVLSCKVHVTLYARFWRNLTAPVLYENFHLDQHSYIVLATDDIEELLHKIFHVFTQRVHTKLEISSDLIWDRLLHLDLLYVKYDPIRGFGYVELPDYLKKFGKSLCNVKNSDNMCLVWAILSMLYPKNSQKCDPKRYKQHVPNLNLDGFDFNSSSTLHSARADLKRMEKNNEWLSICCYVMNEKEKAMNVFHVSERYHPNPQPSIKEVNLLLIHDSTGVDTAVRYHFVGISNLKFLATRLHTRSKRCDFEICRKCLSITYSKAKAEDHFLICQNNEAQRVSLPPPKTIYKFKDHAKSEPLDFCAYSDVETYVEPLLSCDPEPLKTTPVYGWMKYEREAVHVKSCLQCTPESACSSIKPLQVRGRHVPYAWALKLQCFLPGYYDDFKLHVQAGLEEDILMEKYLLLLKDYCYRLYDIVNYSRGIIMTDADKQAHAEATQCKYCERYFDDEDCKKQADHHHLSGVYR